MGEHIHETVPIQVWVDVDEGIADFVRWLNTLPGIRTHACCQGTIGEDGPHPYEGYALVSWKSEEAREQIAHLRFDQTDFKDPFARVYPAERGAKT